MSRSRLNNGYIKDKYKDGRLPYYKSSENPDPDNRHRLDEMPKNRPSKYISTHGGSNAGWLQEPGSFSGHKPHREGHRMVSGIVRANVKEEVRKEIENELNE